jgi:integrase/recombinase XerD
MITTLAEQGVDLKAIARLAGHSSISTTCIYVEDNPARLARIMSGIEII